MGPSRQNMDTTSLEAYLQAGVTTVRDASAAEA